jgi:hypothetical protein
MLHRLPPNVLLPFYLKCHGLLDRAIAAAITLGLAGAVALSPGLAGSAQASAAQPGGDVGSSVGDGAGSGPAASAPPAAATARDAQVGRRLYDLVQAYSALGDHRVGSPVDAATGVWFSDQLRRRGGRVESLPFRFDRYDASSRVTIDGHEVASLALYYEGLGELSDEHPYVAAVAVLDNDRPTPALLDTIAKARAAGARSIVIATLNPLGELQTPNRVPVAGDGPPVILVPGRFADGLRSGKVQLKFSGRIAAGRSANIVAAFGDPSQAPIVINTPLTGWFTCAAERGTGIAIALALAERIAPQHAVLVVGSPGHELLPHLGLSAFLQQSHVQPALVVHLGANVALGRQDDAGRWKLIETRAVGARVDPGAFARMQPALESLDLKPYLNPPRWFGEGELWANAVTSPLISVVGIGPQFHSPADTPENTTSPALLSQAFEGIAGAIEAWMVTP